MDETQKPFACKVEGCKSSFTNEDRLMVHTKTHSMSLQLGMGNKASAFIADQTPTPTRLISKCDEVGLFDDYKWQLQNPFDETFRRAFEAKSTASTPIGLPGGVDGVDDGLAILRPVLLGGMANSDCSCLGDETLNTPHVFPFHDVTAADCRFVASPLDPQHRSLGGDPLCSLPCPLSLSTATTPAPVPMPEKLRPPMSRHKTPPPPEDVPLKMPKLVILSAPTAAAPAEQAEKKTSPMLGKALPKLVHLTKQSSCTTIVKPTDPIVCDKPEPIALSSQAIREALKRQLAKRDAHNEQPSDETPAITPNNPCSPPKSCPEPEDCEDSKLATGQRFERNRAAAKRYRCKMKEWKVEMLATNTRLADENRALRAQIDKLNALLLAHQKCSVSKAMAEGNCIPIGPPKVLIKSASQQCANGRRPIQPNTQAIPTTAAVQNATLCLVAPSGDITTNPIYFAINQKTGNCNSNNISKQNSNR